jgi:A/G-specific adenine glycosylase
MVAVMAAARKQPDIAADLLGWYDCHRRHLPWRAAPGQAADPYRVWLSEIMLQQTTVATVGPYFTAFLERWPDVVALAAAPLDDVLHQWQGLGYYARARNLHRCAQVVAGQHGGAFPDTESGLRELPGIGAYTAAAIAAIAFGRKANVVDGNVERVVARLFAVTEPLPGVKEKLRALADTLVPQHRAGDYAQALMDLGSAICIPRKPKCAICPLLQDCRARRLGIAEDLPARQAKVEKPTRHAIAFIAIRPDGALLLRRRAEKGMLGGMMEVPSSEWRTGGWTLDEAVAQAPVRGRWRTLPGAVRHTFTHFHFEIVVAMARVSQGVADRADGRWVSLDGLGGQALPTVMKKIIAHGLRHSVDARDAA